MTTIREEIKALHARADRAYATCDVECIGEVVTDLLELMGRLLDGQIEMKVIRVSTVDIKENTDATG